MRKEVNMKKEMKMEKKVMEKDGQNAKRMPKKKK